MSENMDKTENHPSIITDTQSDKQRVFKIITIVFRVIFLLTCWTGIVTLFYPIFVSIFTDGISWSSFNIFNYYTTQSNLLITIWITIATIFWKRSNKMKILHNAIHGAVTLYIFITFLIFATLLESMYDPVGFYLAQSIITHYIVPILAFIDWLLMEINRKSRWIYLVYWLCYPLIYLSYSLIRGAIVNEYPYPFLDLNELRVGMFLLNILGITTVFLLIGSGFIGLNRLIFTRSLMNEQQFMTKNQEENIKKPELNN